MRMKTMLMIVGAMCCGSLASAHGYGRGVVQRPKYQAPKEQKEQKEHTPATVDGRDYQVVGHNALNGDKLIIVWGKEGGGNRATLDKYGNVYW